MLSRKAIHYFIFGNFSIAFSAVALTYLSQSGKTISNDDLHLQVFVFFSTLLVYNLNLIEGMKGLKASAFRSVRHNWIVKHEKTIWAFAILALIISVAELFVLKKETLVFLLLPGVFALGYAIPIKVPGMKTIRLRELPFVKIFLVAWVWGTFTVGLPIVQQSGMQELLKVENFLLFFSRSVFIFAITIPFDIRDLTYDTDKNVATIPSVMGIEKSKYFSVALLILFSAICFLRFQLSYCSFTELAALALSAATTVILVLMITKDRKELFYSGLMDGTMLFQWLLVMLLSKIF
jgi:4-hydroxybenzoate polyprenyltransferase